MSLDILKYRKEISVVLGTFGILYLINRKKTKLDSLQDFEKAMSSGQILNPILDASRISSKFGNRKNPITFQTHFHNGIDIPAPTGTKLYAPYDSEVTFSGYNDTGGYQLILRSGVVKFGYAHLKESPLFKVGDSVKKGQLVGYVGNTGKSTGSHLHFTLTIDDKKVDPALYFKSYK